MHWEHGLDSRITIILLPVLYWNLRRSIIKHDPLYNDYGNEWYTFIYIKIMWIVTGVINFLCYFILNTNSNNFKVKNKFKLSKVDLIVSWRYGDLNLKWN